MENNVNTQPVVEEESIDWQLYINKVWKGRKTIIASTIVAMIIGLVAAFAMKHKFTVSVLLAPELNSSPKTGGLSDIASMLGMGGLKTANTTDAYNVTMYPKVIGSTPFIADLLNIHVKDAENEIDTTLVGYMTRKEGFNPIGIVMEMFSDEKDKEPEFKHINIFKLTKPQEKVIKALGKSISADVDNKTGETTITVTMDNAVIAATLADSVCAKLRRYIINYRTSKAREDLAYYQKLADESYVTYKKATSAYAYYQDHNRGLILNTVISEGTRLQNEASIATQVYTQMKQQAEMARGKVQEEKPVFAVIQPASVPLKSSNSRRKVLMMFTFMGFALSVAWVLFGPEYLGKAKEMLVAARKEE